MVQGAMLKERSAIASVLLQLPKDLCLGITLPYNLQCFNVLKQRFPFVSQQASGGCVWECTDEYTLIY